MKNKHFNLKKKHHQQSSSNENLSFGFGPFRAKANGAKPLKLFGWGAGIALLFWGVYRWFDGLIDESQSKSSAEQDIRVADSKSANSINEHHEASQDRMTEDNNKTDNDIRLEQAKSEIRMEERRQIAEMRQAAKESTANVPAKDSVSLKEWINRFHARHPMPDYSSIQFLASVLDGCPPGYEDAMMMGLLSELGALCFSKVRAQYLDNKGHSPNIQVVVEGEHGSGKGKIVDLYERIFSKVIDADNEKLYRPDATNVIVQTAGINISRAMFYEIMANNQEVHIFVLESESSTVLDTFKKANGLSFDFLRKAFNNETIYQNNMMKCSVRGSFRVFFNYIFTGTPEAIAELFNSNEVEGGTASRICFAIIPEVDRLTPFMTFPCGGKLVNMQDQIDAWRKKYCFETVDGNDKACQEYEIDLSYVCEALQDWLDEQYNLSEQEGVKERKGERMRMAAIAFHCAIVLHMLAGEPQPNDRKLRKTVKDLTIYIANYCMERYLTKFSDYLPQIPVNETSADETRPANSKPERRPLTQEELREWYYQRGNYDDDGNVIGYGYIAKQLGVNIDSVKYSFKKYKKNKGLI